MRGKSTIGAFVTLVLVVTLAACGGRGGAGGPLPSAPSSNSEAASAGSLSSSTVTTTTTTPTPSPKPSATPFAWAWDIAGEGATPKPYKTYHVLGNQFKTTNRDIDTQKGDYDGDLMPTDPGAKYGGGGQGPAGTKIDNISCDTTMSSHYHIHAFIGLFVNGNQIVIPDGIGMYHAGGDQVDSAGWPNQEVYAFCYYHIHAHDASGMIHMEDPNPLNYTYNQAMFTTGQLFDIWGVKATTTQFGPFLGAVTVYTSGQFSRAHQCFNGTWCNRVGANMYTKYTGDYTKIPLYSHEVIWIEVGSGNPPVTYLPGVSFALSQ